VGRHHLYEDTSKPLILAHQGASFEAPSNTIPAFDRAVEVHADVLETDIHWTKDHEIVISHDDTVDRCSNGHGLIRNMTLRELHQLDYGYRFSVDGGRTFPFRGKGIKIPTLEEILLRYSGIRINIDIKPHSGERISNLIHQIDACRSLSRVGLASFHHDVLVKVRKMCPDISTSASPQEVAYFLAMSSMPFGHRKYAFDTLQVPVRQYGINVVTPRFIKKAKLLKIPVHVWTIDVIEEMKRFVNMGVSGIVTNRPREAVQALFG
jgi:glycerophosphoryl diester phosphodiesterase